MPNLPVVSGSETARALQRLGFVVVRQRGSHIVLRKDSQGCVVPNHHQIKIGTLVLLCQIETQPIDFAKIHIK